jgi:anti-sigma regulatory factor (Ser/Thr protein kinase)
VGKKREVPQLRGDPSVEFSAVLEPRSTAPRAARQFVTGVVTMLGLTRMQSVAALVVSELVTNAFQHGEGLVVVRVELQSEGVLRLEVSDSGGDEPVERRPGPDSEHGRGLWVVGLLSRGWGVDARNGGGKTVWADLGG